MTSSLVPGAFEPRMDVLPPSQRALWPLLRPTAPLGFVLYGGTAIALRLAHRPSIDFDFFSHQPLDRAALAAAFSFLTQATVLQDERNTLSLITQGAGVGWAGVKVSFFGAIGFGRIGVPDISNDGVLQVASLQDLMATKLKVILQRAEAKDYLDIAAMLGAGVGLAAGLAGARHLFGPNFQPSESLKALVYFADGDLASLPHACKALLIKAASAVAGLPQARLASQCLTAD
jgi:Nucleotidyl transferase AbiEii toxin, Type IV TA system